MVISPEGETGEHGRQESLRAGQHRDRAEKRRAPRGQLGVNWGGGMKTSVAIFLAAGLFGAGLLAGVLLDFGDGGPGKSSHSRGKPVPAGPPGAPMASESANASEWQSGQAEISSSNIASRLAELLRSTSGEKQRLAFAELTENLDAAQVREAVCEVNSYPRDQTTVGLEQLLSRWGKIEPAEALKYAAAKRDRLDRENAFESVLAGWAEKDAAAAEHYVLQMPGRDIERLSKPARD